MEQRRAEAPKEFGKECKLRKDAPEYLKQLEPNRAHPELIRMVKENHRKTMGLATSMTSKPLLKDNGC